MTSLLQAATDEGPGRAAGSFGVLTWSSSRLSTRSPAPRPLDEPVTRDSALAGLPPRGAALLRVTCPGETAYSAVGLRYASLPMSRWPALQANLPWATEPFDQVDGQRGTPREIA